MGINTQLLSIELTPHCNNACLHCYNYWGRDRKRAASAGVLTREEIRSLLRKVKEDAPLHSVALSGGEPLLRKDLPHIVGDVFDEGLQPVVITNGALLSSQLLRKLPSGVQFEVTLLGSRAELHNRLAGANVFDRVIRNAARIGRHGSYLTAVFVASAFNAHEAHNVYELAFALGASGFMYNRVNLSRGSKSVAKRLVPTAAALEESLGLVHKSVRKYGIQAFCSVPILPCLTGISQFPDIQFGWCPRGGDNAYYTVGYDGMLRPCNHSSVVLGDLRTESFSKLVTSRKCRDFWRPVPAVCKECTSQFRDECRGGCTASSMEFYGSQDHIDPFYGFAAGTGPRPR